MKTYLFEERTYYVPQNSVTQDPITEERARVIVDTTALAQYDRSCSIIGVEEARISSREQPVWKVTALVHAPVEF